MEPKLTQHSNPDVILSDGREVVIDLNAISISEFRAMLKPDQPDEDEYRVIEKMTGLAEVGKLGLQDYRKIISAFFEKAKQPVNPI